MSPLIILLWIKIAVTVFMLVIPFTLLPSSKLEKLTGFGHAAPGFYRLYGLAMLSICVAYYSGIETAKEGSFPQIIVIMGILSNAGGALISWLGRFEKRNWSGVIIFGAIAVGLIIMLFNPEWAIRTI